MKRLVNQSVTRPPVVFDLKTGKSSSLIFLKGMEMTVYAYARVSTLQQANEGDSLEAQVKQVLGYASSRGLELHKDGVFVEKGVSGGQEFGSRPAGSKLLASLQSGDIVIFPKLDRGFRNTRDANFKKSYQAEHIFGC